MDRNLALEVVRVTEAAALAASRLMGRGDEKAADQAAVDAMREALNSLSIDGTVVIGEGERDEAPMLFIGEKVGSGNGPPIDIALDPLEGTTITAKGVANARAAGARIALISDGDVSGVIATSEPETGIDMYVGSGGAPEGVLAAAALRCIGGQIQGRLLFRNDDERGRAAKWGIKDLNRKYKL